MNILFLTLFCLLTMAFAWKRGLTFLRYFQQEEYDGFRFLNWWLRKLVFDKRFSLIMLALAGLAFVGVFASWVLLAMATVATYVLLKKEKDPREDGKKPLVLTPRAKRVAALALACFIIDGLVLLIIARDLPLILFIGALLLIQAVPLYTVLGNWLLWPYEKWTQRRFLKEAQAKLEKINPYVIGITGSFGKTSTKHILAHILSNLAPTLHTPGSVNTPMGITRIIREQLTQKHKYFIVEMGAYGPGSIARLCKLTPPEMGIITTVGHAHYERFKTLDTVAKTKFELAEAVAQQKGATFVGDHLLSYDAAKAVKKEGGKLIAVGMKSKSPVRILDVKQKKTGLSVKVEYGNEKHTLSLPLFGEHHASNAVFAFALALELGFDGEHIKTALASTPQIAHRLEVKPQVNGTIIIDDAYNANPQGVVAALDIMSLLANKKAKRVLVTPGMVELGKAHDEEHTKLGKYALDHADVLVAVAPERIESLIAGYEKHGGQKVVRVANFNEARKWLSQNTQSGDVILLANDLPDLFESVPSL